MGHKNVKEVLLNNNSNHIEHLFSNNSHYFKVE